MTLGKAKVEGRETAQQGSESSTDLNLQKDCSRPQLPRRYPGRGRGIPAISALGVSYPTKVNSVQRQLGTSHKVSFS